MATDIGNQTVTVKFFDPIDNDVVNRIGLDTRKKGIYSGGYLTRVSDVSVSLSALTCEIGDGIYQVRVATAIDVSISVTTTNKYIVLRWTYTATSSDYMELLAVPVGSVGANDIVVGVCTFSGSTLLDFDYTLRTTPEVMNLFLKAEPTIPASMRVRVRAGRISYGTANFDLIDQKSPLFIAPTTGTRVDALQINTSGALIVTQGTTVPPSYNGLITIAEISLAVAQTSITSTHIKDVRNFIGFSPDAATFVTLSTVQTITGAKTFTTLPVGPSAAPTANYQMANKKYVDDQVATRVFGNYISRSVNTNYVAPTDGILVATCSASTNAPATFYITVDGTQIGRMITTSSTTQLTNSITIPVKKGSTWRVITSGQQYINTVYWMPIGI